MTFSIISKYKNGYSVQFACQSNSVYFYRVDFHKIKIQKCGIAYKLFHQFCSIFFNSGFCFFRDVVGAAVGKYSQRKERNFYRYNSMFFWRIIREAAFKNF